MSNWYTTLDGVKTQCWTRLVMGAQDRIQVAFGTVSTSGWPEVRTVVLRAADPDARTLAVYTDLQSDKITSLQAMPRAAIHLWDADLNLQIRLQVEVEIQTGPKVRKLWEAVPDHSRLSYGVTPAPGQIIPSDTAYTKAPDAKVFAVLQCSVAHLEAVYLGKTHRRAAFSRLSDWAGNWLAP